MIFLKSFAVGGIICVIGQILIDNTKLTSGRILVGYVVAGVILAAVGLYEPIKEFASSGATVPLTGFGYNLVEGTKKAVEEQGLIGVLTGPLTSCSAGVMAALLSGLAVSVFTKPKSK
ncbi:MAG: SpoVA/SpoVAEb family sporulation membrane protein [Clostridiales bacterium]|nr:SpoVA/SpoVAEb family sporulation membrane protein [Clostridiales bacterium]